MMSLFPMKTECTLNYGMHKHNIILKDCEKICAEANFIYVDERSHTGL